MEKSLSEYLALAKDVIDLKLENKLKVVTKTKPSIKQLNSLKLAFNICKFVKSNGIVLVKNKSTIGIGSGQPSRLDSCKLAIDKMRKFTKMGNEMVAASDAFFPFVDGFEKLVQSGVKAVVQPAGSIRDNEVIKFANATGVNCKPFLSVTTSVDGSNVYAPDVLTVFAICYYLYRKWGSV